jgi:hypothetical protein
MSAALIRRRRVRQHELDTLSFFLQHDSDYPHAPGVIHGSCQPCDQFGNKPPKLNSLPSRQSLESRYVVELDYTPDKMVEHSRLLEQHNKKHSNSDPWEASVLGHSGQRCYRRAKETMTRHPWLLEKSESFPVVDHEEAIVPEKTASKYQVAHQKGRLDLAAAQAKLENSRLARVRAVAKPLISKVAGKPAA